MSGFFKPFFSSPSTLFSFSLLFLMTHTPFLSLPCLKYFSSLYFTLLCLGLHLPNHTLPCLTSAFLSQSNPILPYLTLPITFLTSLLSCHGLTLFYLSLPCFCSLLFLLSLQGFTLPCLSLFTLALFSLNYQLTLPFFALPHDSSELNYNFQTATQDEDTLNETELFVRRIYEKRIWMIVSTITILLT